MVGFIVLSEIQWSFPCFFVVFAPLEYIPTIPPSDIQTYPVTNLNASFVPSSQMLWSGNRMWPIFGKGRKNFFNHVSTSFSGGGWHLWKKQDNFRFQRIIEKIWYLNGQKYSGDLKSGLVWILNGRKEVGLQMVSILNGIWNLEAQPLGIRTNAHHFDKKHI